MKTELKEKQSLQNRFLYSLTSLFLYFALYLMVSLNLKDFFQPLMGAIILVISIITDFYFARKRLRIYIRFLLIILIYLLMKLILRINSELASAGDSYNIFDKLPYLFDRDTIISLLFVLFYFIFDSIRIKKHNKLTYIISSLVLLSLFTITLRVEDYNIRATTFGNYFNYSLALIAIMTLFILRHIFYYHSLVRRPFKRRDLLLLLLLLFPVFTFLMSVTLQSFMNSSNKSNSALMNQSIFQFDFSNFVELKDEIKMSDDKVLIMELKGADSHVEKRLSEEWERQIYLKRFSLEEYTKGTFRMAERFLEEDLPPVYLSGYMWERERIPNYKNRIEIMQTLYLLNIDSSSLMGSDLLTKVVPLTAWPDSPYKQIYRSHSYIFDGTNLDMMITRAGQERYLSSLERERKALLTYWGESEEEQRIREMALEITEGYPSALYKALAIQKYLHDNYLYSLKPGLSPSKSQLLYFLEDSKKGYCSYFAFAMTLMLRSVGVASRVAVGFAPNMENRTLNFYEIRALDAHAWVEVYLDDFGWITFDPTSSNISPDEEYEFALSNKEERDDLISEILKNRDKLKEITEKEEKSESPFKDLTRQLKRSIRAVALLFNLTLLALFLLFIYYKRNSYLLRYRVTGDIRKKTRNLYKHILTKLLLLGYRIGKSESLEEYAHRLEEEKIADIKRVTSLFQEATFKEQKGPGVSPAELEEERKKIIGQLKELPMKKRALSLFNLSVIWRRILPLILLILLATLPQRLEADEKVPLDSIEDYIIEADRELNESHFDRALTLLNEAEERYPDSYLPNYRKGRLYYRHDLYENAILEFSRAKEKGYRSEILYTYLANSYGKSGKDEKAVEIYEEAYNTIFRSEDIYDNLGWMYFKVHDTVRGIEFIQEGLEFYPESPDLYMTLGTLYSSAWEYDLAKECYLKSIRYSNKRKSNNFRAIAYYNLALLEDSFLYYKNALSSARASLSIKKRSTAHLELNYLYLKGLKLKEAYNEVVKASTLEPVTAFPQLSLVNIFIYSGRLDEAIELSHELLRSKDYSWMFYFGTSIDEFHSEIYNYLAQAYKYKAAQLSFSEKRTFRSSLASPFRKLYYRSLSLFYNYRFTNLSITLGEDKLKGGSELEGLHMLYNGMKELWPSKARKILSLARRIEEEKNPAVKRLYDLEESILDSRRLFNLNPYKELRVVEAINNLDREWEVESRVEGLIRLIKMSSGEERTRYSEELFKIHPQFLPMNSIKSPMKIKFSENIERKEQKQLLKEIKRIGIVVDEGSELSLEIDLNEKNSYNAYIYSNSRLLSYHKVKTDVVQDFGWKLFERVFIYNQGE